MLGKTNIIYVTKDQNLEMQFVKEYIQTKSTSDISKIEYYNGMLFARTGQYVLYGPDAENLEYIKYNDAMLEITDVQFFAGKYIFYNRNKVFASDENNGLLTLEYYTGSNLLQLEKKCLTHKIDGNYKLYGNIISAKISSDNNLVFLIYVWTQMSTNDTYCWYVINILSDLNTVQKEIATEKKIGSKWDNSHICFMRDRFFGLNYVAGTNSYCDILSLEGILAHKERVTLPNAIINDIAYYIVAPSKVYYSINFIDKVLIDRVLIQANMDTKMIFSIGDRIAFYDKSPSISESILSLASSVNDIKDKMTSIVVGNLCDYDVYCWVDAEEYTYFGCSNGIIAKCFLDIEGNYQLPEVTLIKTLAARQALDQAKQYTDEKNAELKNYINNLKEEIAELKSHVDSLNESSI